MISGNSMMTLTFTTNVRVKIAGQLLRARVIVIKMVAQGAILCYGQLGNLNLTTGQGNFINNINPRTLIFGVTYL